MTRVRRKDQTEVDQYLALVRRFPLRPIRTEPDYDRANAILTELLARADTGLSDGERDYVEALTRFVRDFDDLHYRLALASDLNTPVARLKYLMHESGMNTMDLGKLVGGRGQASLVLNGKRELSKANIRTLASRFKVNPSVFL